MTPQPQPRPAAAEARWAGLVSERLRRVGVSDWRSGEAVAGLAAWCVREAPAPVVRTEQVDAWLAHALCAVGQAQAAGHIAPCGRMPSPAAMAAPPLRPLAREGVLRVRGVRRPGEGREWRLDVDRLAGPSAVSELAVSRMLHGAAARLCEAWREAEEMRPRLALRGAARLARRMEGPRAPARRVRRRVCDLRAFVVAVLERAGAGPVSVLLADVDV